MGWAINSAGNMVFVWVSCHRDGLRTGGDELQGSLGRRHHPRRSCLPKPYLWLCFKTIPKYSEVPAAMESRGLVPPWDLGWGFLLCFWSLFPVPEIGSCPCCPLLSLGPMPSCAHPGLLQSSRSLAPNFSGVINRVFICRLVLLILFIPP